jgi:hypothetical protein
MAAGNPLGFTDWLHHKEDGADDAGDDVELGNFNQLSDDDREYATIIQNVAEKNPALVGQNVSNNLGGVGLLGQSNASQNGVGVLGACDMGWGVGGIATPSDVRMLDSVVDPSAPNPVSDPYDPTVDPHDTGWPVQVGVFGIADGTGVYGQSRPGESQKISDIVSAPQNGTGVYGIGDVAGVHGDADGPTGRGGVFFSRRIAQLQLTPVLSDNGTPPAIGDWGDIWTTVSGSISDGTASAAIYLCIGPGDSANPAVWAPFTLGDPIPGQ